MLPRMSDTSIARRGWGPVRYDFRMNPPTGYNDTNSSNNRYIDVLMCVSVCALALLINPDVYVRMLFVPHKRIRMLEL